MFKAYVVCIAVFLGITLPATGKADLILELRQGSSSALSSLNIVAGDLVILDLYIGQTGTTVRLNDESTSINTADVTIQISGGTGISPSLPIVFGNFFEDTGNTSIVGQSLRFSVQSTKSPANPTSEVPGVTAADDGVADNLLYIGSFGIESAFDTTGSRTLELFGNTDSFGNLTTSPDTVLSGGLDLTPATLQLNVTAVPEPSALVYMLTCLGTWACVRWRSTYASTTGKFEIGIKKV